MWCANLVMWYVNLVMWYVNSTNPQTAQSTFKHTNTRARTRSACLQYATAKFTHIGRDRQTETDRLKKRERKRQTERQRETDRERETERDRQTERQTNRERDRQTERDRDIETERSHSQRIAAKSPFAAPNLHFAVTK